MRKKRNQAIYGTTALQAEASPESKPSLKRTSPPRIVNGSGVVATTTYDWRAPVGLGWSVVAEEVA